MHIGFNSPRPRQSRSFFFRACLLACVALPSTVFAQAGVRELNQTCAVQTGCFAGDVAGFPITIDGTSGRSYRLTSDLVVPNENTTAVSLSTAATSVSIDLGGFEITRAACVGVTSSCVPTTGTGLGIGSFGTPPQGTWVHDGTVTGMGDRGVYLGDRAQIHAVRARWNRNDGLRIGSYGRARDSIAHGNGAYGLLSGAGGVISGVSAMENTNGIGAGAGSTIVDSAASNNSSSGIVAGSGSSISRNAVTGNGGDGIQTSLGALVSSNASYNNSGDGIQTSGGCTVDSNAVRDNEGFGLNLGSQSGYRGNVVSLNAAGTIGGTGLVNLGGNACNGSVSCP